MQEFDGKVAVVTGAASGIGRALAERFAREGMKVVLADVERDALDAAVKELRQQEFDVLGVETNVARAADVEALAKRTVDAYGGVHVLCNNAGVVAGSGSSWEHTLKDWEWLLGINLMGVVHGIHYFLPIMLEQDEGHVVNTSSVLGLVARNGAPYGVSKFAVQGLTEGLYYDLQARGSNVKCSVLCPGAVATSILAAERNRPDEYRDVAPTSVERHAEEERRVAAVARWHEFSMPPVEVVEAVVSAIRDERFYVLTHLNVLDGVRRRMEDILAQRNPSAPAVPTGGGLAALRPVDTTR